VIPDVLYIPPTTSGTKTPTVWLCRPGLSDNPCEADQTATIVRPDGTTSMQAAMPAKDPPIDCFYVYPAVSQQLAVNADLTIGAEEREVAILQASRFSQVCQVYYTAQCMNSNGASWLQINDIAGPGDHRWVVHPSNSQTGLHIYDLNLALGNLDTLVGEEAAAYTR